MLPSPTQYTQTEICKNMTLLLLLVLWELRPWNGVTGGIRLWRCVKSACKSCNGSPSSLSHTVSGSVTRISRFTKLSRLLLYLKPWPHESPLAGAIYFHKSVGGVSNKPAAELTCLYSFIANILSLRAAWRWDIIHLIWSFLQLRFFFLNWKIIRGGNVKTTILPLILPYRWAVSWVNRLFKSGRSTFHAAHFTEPKNNCSSRFIEATFFCIHFSGINLTDLCIFVFSLISSIQIPDTDSIINQSVSP